MTPTPFVHPWKLIQMGRQGYAIWHSERRPLSYLNYHLFRLLEKNVMSFTTTAVMAR